MQPTYYRLEDYATFHLHGERVQVSRERMVVISPKFATLFDSMKDNTDTCTHFGVDPDVLRWIINIAHGEFVPQGRVPLEGLLGLARSLEQLEIPPQSRVHSFVEFGFKCRSSIGILPSLCAEDLTKLLRIATYLHADLVCGLLRDIVEHHNARLDPSMESIEMDHCLSWLTMAFLIVAETRWRSGKALHELIMDAPSGSDLEAKSQLQYFISWIMSDYPSLSLIRSSVTTYSGASEVYNIIDEGIAEVESYGQHDVRTNLGVLFPMRSSSALGDQSHDDDSGLNSTAIYTGSTVRDDFDQKSTPRSDQSAFSTPADNGGDDDSDYVSQDTMSDTSTYAEAEDASTQSDLIESFQRLDWLDLAVDAYERSIETR